MTKSKQPKWLWYKCYLNHREHEATCLSIYAILNGPRNFYLDKFSFYVKNNIHIILIMQKVIICQIGPIFKIAIL